MRNAGKSTLWFEHLTFRGEHLKGTESGEENGAKQILICGLSANSRFFQRGKCMSKLNEASPRPGDPAYEGLKAQLAALQAQVNAKPLPPVKFLVDDKGAISVRGLGRFPVSLYYEQWDRILNAADRLRAFMEQEKAAGHLKLKGEEKPLPQQKIISMLVGEQIVRSRFEPPIAHREPHFSQGGLPELGRRR